MRQARTGLGRPQGRNAHAPRRQAPRPRQQTTRGPLPRRIVDPNGPVAVRLRVAPSNTPSMGQTARYAAQEKSSHGRVPQAPRVGRLRRLHASPRGHTQTRPGSLQATSRPSCSMPHVRTAPPRVCTALPPHAVLAPCTAPLHYACSTPSITRLNRQGLVLPVVTQQLPLRPVRSPGDHRACRYARGQCSRPRALTSRPRHAPSPRALTAPCPTDSSTGESCTPCTR